ncbi:MAG: GGDEF domain-containing protein [Synergistaceae bacterium]|nr:GGDEF domain-containing protein [Synergistaceae bacterium]
MEVLFSRAHLGLDEVLGLHSGDFRPISGNVVRFWNVKDELWIRIPMSKLREMDRALPAEKAVLSLQCGLFSSVGFYIPTAEGEFTYSAYGIGTFLEEQRLPQRFPAFFLSGDYDNGHAYLNVRTNIPVSFGVSVQDEDVHHYIVSRFVAGYLIFYSCLMALTLTCLLLYLMTGDPGYAIAALRQLGALIFLFIVNDVFLYIFCLTYSFTLPPRTVYILCWLGLGLHGVMQAFLCRHLLRTDEEPAWLKRLIYAHALLCVIMAASAFRQEPHITLALAVLALIMDTISFLAVGFLKFRQGYHVVFLFVLSRLAFMLGCVALSTIALYVPHTYVAESFLMVFFLLDPILLFLMMIPDTRRRFMLYFFMENKEGGYDVLSERDGLTGLYNKASFLALFDGKFKAAQKALNPLAFIVMDIDYFQEYSKSRGRQEGDKLLIFLAKLTRQSLRESDVAARHAGGEFGIILPGGTLPFAVLVAERIRQGVEKYGAALNKPPAVTLSVGMSFMKREDTMAELIQRGYEALHLARNNGCNRTEFELSV